jgi:hypothetical protein
MKRTEETRRPWACDLLLQLPTQMRNGVRKKLFLRYLKFLWAVLVIGPSWVGIDPCYELWTRTNPCYELCSRIK